MRVSFVFAVLSSVLSFCRTENDGTRPNIIVIVADDMGFNDVGFHGSDEIPTPNIDALAYNGVILNRHYTQALCTPSRSAFLTGKYPIHLGMQHLVILEPEPWGLPLNETLIPQYLKRNGYSTHAIGKWHLGFFRKEYTPTYRGFDTHFGYWQGLQDYYEHTVHATYTPEKGYDMRKNLTVDYNSKGKYSTTLFTEEAIRLINQHDTKKPMFMYFAHLAPHTGNDNDPLQAPDEEIAKFAHIDDPERRIYAAMVSMLDQSVGSVITALREKHMLENSIILFMSDNGAQPRGIHANHGSNYPLRGVKNSAWEGGIRNIAAIWSPKIKRPQRVSQDMMHISDWLPTFYSAAGLDKDELPEIDGMDMWKTISEGAENPRTEFVINIDEKINYGGVRVGDWKYLYGSTNGGKADTWFDGPEINEYYHYDTEKILSSKVANALAGVITYEQIKEKNHQNSNTNFTIKLINEEMIRRLRDNATVKCNSSDKIQELGYKECIPLLEPCLFNVQEDPCEQNNLIDQKPLIAKQLSDILDRYRKTALPPRNVPRDPNANPANWNNTWTNWKDFEFVLKEKLGYNELSPLAIGLVTTAGVVVFILVTILLALKCKHSSNKSRRSRKSGSLFEDNVEDPEVEVISRKGSLFEDRELQVRTYLKDEIRTVE